VLSEFELIAQHTALPNLLHFSPVAGIKKFDRFRTLNNCFPGSFSPVAGIKESDRVPALWAFVIGWKFQPRCRD
jgi:hypothetical protein